MPSSTAFSNSSLEQGFLKTQYDVVELAPDYDSSGASTAVATKVIRELLMVM